MIVKVLLLSLLLVNVSFSSSKDERFEELSPTVVLDKKTNLMWESISSYATHDKKEAAEYCKMLVLNSIEDWRVPSLHEVLSIVDYSKKSY